MPGDLRAEVEAILSGWLERHEPFCPNHGRQGGGGCGSNCWPIRDALRALRAPSSPEPETAPLDTMLAAEAEQDARQERIRQEDLEASAYYVEDPPAAPEAAASSPREDGGGREP